jgi:hypothetical protein
MSDRRSIGLVTHPQSPIRPARALPGARRARSQGQAQHLYPVTPSPTENGISRALNRWSRIRTSKMTSVQSGLSLQNVDGSGSGQVQYTTHPVPGRSSCRLPAFCSTHFPLSSCAPRVAEALAMEYQSPGTTPPVRVVVRLPYNRPEVSLPDPPMVGATCHD